MPRDVAPAITLTSAPSRFSTGIDAAACSWYAGACILSALGRLTQSWKPRIRPSVCSGISECTMPRPARHPLDAAGLDHALVAVVVLVPHAPVQHVRHRLEAAVRMRREAGEVVARVRAVEVVEHQERVDRGHPRVAAHQAREADTGAVGGRDAAGDAGGEAGGGHGRFQMRASHGCARGRAGQ